MASSSAEANNAKSPSAKTIVLRPSSTTSVKTVKSVDKEVTASSKEAPATKTLSSKEDPEVPNDEAEAATKIQAAFRGHKTRKSMKQPAGKTENQQEQEPTREQLEEEFRLDDVELCHAATKIQASFRGHMTRKQEADKKNESSSSHDTKHQNADDEELDIDLADPDLNKAAIKIQASFRGHMVRKENEDESKDNKVSNN